MLRFRSGTDIFLGSVRLSIFLTKQSWSACLKPSVDSTSRRSFKVTLASIPAQIATQLWAKQLPPQAPQHIFAGYSNDYKVRFGSGLLPYHTVVYSFHRWMNILLSRNATQSRVSCMLHDRPTAQVHIEILLFLPVALNKVRESFPTWQPVHSSR